MHLLVLAMSVAVAQDQGDDPCPERGACFESSRSSDYQAYVQALDHMVDTLVAPKGGTGQLGTGYTTLHEPKGGDLGGPFGDVWTEQGMENGELTPGHFIEHWFLDDPSGLPAPELDFAFEFQEQIEDTDMVEILTGQKGWEDDAYIRMDLRYAEIPTLVQTEDLTYVGDSVQRHAYRGWRTDSAGDLVVSCYLLRETHFDEDGDVERRLDHWVLYSDSVDTVLLDKEGDSIQLEALPGEPTPITFYAWHQLNPNVPVKRAAVVDWVYGDVQDWPPLSE